MTRKIICDVNSTTLLKSVANKLFHGLPSMNRALARNPLFVLVFLIAASCLFSASSFAQTTNTQPPPVQMTAGEDHQRMLKLLQIPSLRRGPDGDPKSPNAANFDESKVTAYKLPDPLVLNDGKKVTTAKVWWSERRPEIVEAFDKDVYGRVPAHTPKVEWKVTHTA